MLGRRFHCFCQPEVQHFHRAVWPKLDVCRLQVTVDDPLLVCRFERVGNLLRDRQRLGERNGSTCDPLGEVFTFDEFHDEGGTPPLSSRP